jgi:tetratricopeptide (TPR) repeat protein
VNNLSSTHSPKNKKEAAMKIKHLFLGILAVCFLISCYGGPGGGSSSSPAVSMALNSPKDFENKDAASQNDQGVDHLQQGHWAVSAEHFQKAVAAAPNLAEAHFNLGLALDEMGKHPEATEEFKKAKELAPGNAKIAENDIVKKHLGM